MMKTRLYLFFQFAVVLCVAQQSVSISGTVRDATDQSGISYAMVSVPHTALAAQCDKQGHFTLGIGVSGLGDSVLISCIGYQSRILKISSLKPADNLIILNRSSLSLREVTVGPGKERVITARMIEKMMSKVHDTLYMSKYETSFYLYKAFLEDIARDKPTLLEAVDFQYNDKYAKGKFGYSEQVAWYNNKSPASDNYPAADITHDAANEFCAWLTEKYMSFKKRKYKEAAFRLPSESEWIYTAQGGNKKKTRFPWPGDKPYYIVPGDTVKRPYVHYYGDRADTVFVTCGYIQYGYRSAFGIHMICDNVSEMVQEKGIYKGGCVMDKLENIGIYAPQAPDRHDPDFLIGFRVAMILKK